MCVVSRVRIPITMKSFDLTRSGPMILALSVGLLLPGPAISAAEPGAASLWIRPMAPELQTTHVLNRLGFGPRPGDVERVKRMGVRPYIEEQLAWSALDDTIVDVKSEASFKVMRLETRKLMLAYAGDSNQMLRRAMQAQKAQEKGKKNQPAAATTPVKMEEVPARVQLLMDRMEKEGIPMGTSGQAVGELISDKLLRATESKKQLQEVLVDFWSNHFNEDVKKGPVAALKVPDERFVIRPNLNGSFRTLLGATAKSPAMLWYLDNAMSTVEKPQMEGKRKGGINENYARELMELHTLGVDGGYTQQDVQEVARCLTGWGLNRATGEFRFNPREHDNGPKRVLGVEIPAGGGIKDGEQVLDILAAHPSTAKFLAKKLCMRFVSDEPPASLLNKVAAAFTASQGDLTATYRALFLAPEFLAQGAYRAKIKSPLEFVVSSVRALGGTYSPPNAATPMGRMQLVRMGSLSMRPNRGARQARPILAAELHAMGQPLFSCQPPTGYTEDSRAWVSSSALVARLNYALALTGGRIADVQLTADTYKSASVNDAALTLLAGDIQPSTRQSLEKELQTTPEDGARLRALVLGTPEFQRR